MPEYAAAAQLALGVRAARAFGCVSAWEGGKEGDKRNEAAFSAFRACRLWIFKVLAWTQFDVEGLRHIHKLESQIVI